MTISPRELFDLLHSVGVSFFTGVPDSLFKDFCNFLCENLSDEDHVIAANEGSAVAIAAGYHLATGKLPVVYLQNSGLGNMINPLLSLADEEVYSIPMLVLMGWRGEPGVPDEPQHCKQGRVMLGMLQAMQLEYSILSPAVVAKDTVTRMMTSALARNAPSFVVCTKGAMSSSSMQVARPLASNTVHFVREQAITILASALHGAVTVSTTGKISRELYEARERLGQGHKTDFLTVGSMGHASQVALGIAMKSSKKVLCLDGDGAAIMHMGSLATIGWYHPANLIHVVINNGAHESVGGQPTAGLIVNFPKLASACGYRTVLPVASNEVDLLRTCQTLLTQDCPTFLEVRVAIGSRDDLCRPKERPLENKAAFVSFLEA